jgi:two-component system chemotaxis sensor kinase CheA
VFVNKLTPLVGAQYGVFYIRQGTEDQKWFEKMSTYATLFDQNALKNVRFGEGLIGQCAAEKKPIILSDLPEDYVKISSGSGLGTPKNIYILPAEYEGEVLAVLEVATFKTFTSAQLEL